jgi:hypothetical protein
MTPVEPRSLFGLLVLKPGAENAGQVADILGDQKIVLHEPFDRGKARMVLIAETLGDIALNVEGEPLFGLAGEEMHVAAHRPEEIFGLFEKLEFAARQHAETDQFGGVADMVEVFGDPEQRVEIAQSALAFLDIGFDKIAGVPGLAVAFVALGRALRR